MKHIGGFAFNIELQMNVRNARESCNAEIEMIIFPFLHEHVTFTFLLQWQHENMQNISLLMTKQACKWNPSGNKALKTDYLIQNSSFFGSIYFKLCFV